LVAAAPVIDEPRGRLYCILNDDRAGHLCAWSLAARQVLWRYPFERAVAATPAVREDGTVLVADMTGRLQAIKPDGSLAFQCQTDCEYLLAPPVCDARGQAFVSDPTGAIHRIEPGGEGRPLFEAPRALQAQASFDARGRLYLPCTDRHVYVFRNLAAV
jgi:outer membrane protein assembly factor BamB